VPRTTRADLEQAVATVLGNPFAVSAEDFRSARTLLERAEVGLEISRRTRSGDVIGAKRLVLAIAHAQACAGLSAKKILGTEILPQSALKDLPRPRGQYVSIAMAGGRAYAALCAIGGVSDAIGAARRATWAACFGDSLIHALELQQVIIDHDVLILGETGTGKELFARAMQEATPGKGGEAAPSSAINAAAIPDTLVESELFGHMMGAFTGATDTRAGRLRSAAGGSFFLDEVGDLPKTTQVKLLRVMETNEVYPLGSDASHHVEVRYIAATHRDLEAMVDEHEFRRDLFERLAGNVLRIPPLRDRPEDILPISETFIRSYLQDSTSDHIERVSAWLRSSEAQSHRWPGNVRELQNCLRNLLLGLAPGVRPPVASRAAASGDAPQGIREAEASLQEAEDWYLRRVFEANDRNFTQASRVLGIDRSTLRRRLRDA